MGMFDDVAGLRQRMIAERGGQQQPVQGPSMESRRMAQMPSFGQAQQQMPMQQPTQTPAFPGGMPQRPPMMGRPQTEQFPMQGNSALHDMAREFAQQPQAWQQGPQARVNFGALNRQPQQQQPAQRWQQIRGRGFFGGR